jgi:hypothetical protein
VRAFSIVPASVSPQKVLLQKDMRNLAVYWGTPELSGESGVRTSQSFAPFKSNNSIQLGLLPILKWLISLERSPPATRNLLTIERLQGWSMLAYYPLEHVYYLGSHGIIPTVITSPFSLFTSKKRKLSLDLDTIGLWSCRFWAVYVVLHFAHLLEDRKLLKQRYNSLRKAKGTGLTPAEKSEMRQRWDAFWSEVVINLGYLPLTIHW